VLVAGLGLELGRGASVSGQVLEGRVAQLVQGPALLVRVERRACLLEQVLGARIGEPTEVTLTGPAADRPWGKCQWGCLASGHQFSGSMPAQS
jgi:hypothetical protein